MSDHHVFSKLQPDRVTMWWLVAALTLVLLPHLPRLPIWYAPLFLAAVAERMSHFYLPRKPLPGVIRVALVVATISALILANGSILGRGPGVALLCVMLALKLLESYRRREVYLLVTMAYFVVVTQFLFSQQIGMLVYMMATVVVITGVLLVLELQPARQLSQRQPHPMRLLPQLKAAGWLLLQCIPLVVVLFLFFPRLSSPIWGTDENSAFGSTGISGEMTPGQIGKLFLDDSPAMRVVFDGPIPPRNQWYWRGPVLWNFDGDTWRRPDGVLATRAQLADGVTESPSALSYRVTLQPSSRHWLFGLDVPITRPSDGGLQLDHTLYRLKPVRQVTSYDMVSDPAFIQDPELSSRARSRALHLPADTNPRTTALARAWLDELGDKPLEIADRALQKFNQEEYYYTFEPPPLAGEKVDDFLFNTRAGYCEFYSSAFVVLMRSAGIPARVVTGYMGGYYNANQNYVLVRNSDAHAWAEIWVEGRGWVRVDPTAAVAPERIDLGARAAIAQSRGALDYEWLQRLANRLDGFQYLWNEWVIKFNAARQVDLLRPLGIDKLDPRYLPALLLAFTIPFIGFMMFWLIRAQRLAGAERIDRLYHKFCARLARRGVKKRAYEGPVDFAERAKSLQVDLAEWIDAVTGVYVNAKYARAGDPSAAQQMRLLLRQMN